MTALLLCLFVPPPTPPAPDPNGRAAYPFPVSVGRCVSVTGSYGVVRPGDRIHAVNARPTCPWYLNPYNCWWDHTILDHYRPGAVVFLMVTRGGIRYPFLVSIELTDTVAGGVVPPERNPNERTQ